jgi:polyisoprenoid-binding protein YceI
VPDTGKAADVEIPLTVTLHGVTRPESAHTSIQRNGDRVDVAGSIPIRFADYDVHPPKLLGGVLEIQPEATIEFLVRLAKS